MSEIALCAAIGIDAAAATAPEWLHLLPAGAVRTLDGRGPYRVTDAQAMIAASMADGKLVLDENHATDLAAPKGLPAPARGWIVQLQQRGDGIWGRVQWNADGLAVWRGYRGVSPVIKHRPDGTVLSLARASLTNTPNLTGLTALHHAELKMDFRSKIITLLGLAATVDDAAIESEIKRLQGRTDVSTHSHVDAQRLALQAVAYQDKLATLGTTISLPAAVHAVRSGTAI